jgi:hypothetical protein
MTTNAAEVWIALAWGAVASAGLLIGAIVGAVFRMSHHTIARAMSVGAGLLLAGVSFLMVCMVTARPSRAGR